VLGTFAFGTFAAALAPALAVGLHWERVGSRAASWSIGSGLVLSVGLELLARAGRSPLAAGAQPAAAALAASFAVLLLGAWLAPAERSR